MGALISPAMTPQMDRPGPPLAVLGAPSQGCYEDDLVSIYGQMQILPSSFNALSLPYGPPTNSHYKRSQRRVTTHKTDTTAGAGDCRIDADPVAVTFSALIIFRRISPGDGQVSRRAFDSRRPSAVTVSSISPNLRMSRPRGRRRRPAASIFCGL
ncbi:hypothetical protein EVAR_83359_1 [Eumeta japonica]|uniref:Uncharacterized protein n=1 Tax=Eumeta variegata TaxID=151549 RepID=A0A4C1TYF6_EUMVA|nr:hypothetical protein EVAR_83359_1 [Eumeta japonica]